MGRRRWRFVVVAAFLLVISRDADCQEDNDFYYTPVERNFAQVQPPLYPSNRPAAYFEHGDAYRLGQTKGQPPLFNDGQRFPSPNYNQHPSPFQLPTGRGQSSGQYYINQPEFTSTQRQRFRPAFPHNFQLLNPSSTRRPDIPPQIHSVAYQNDPSKPETFLGQITLNNPDIDFLQSGRFKNSPFDGNSLKNINSHVSGLSIDDDDDDTVNDNQDLYENHRVTTYNPNRPGTKTRLNIKSNIGHIPHDDIISDEQESKSTNNKYLQTNLNKSIKLDNYKSTKLINDRFVNSKNYQTTTESKALLDLEPLLEEDISDIASFRELMKNPPNSFNVQVIKANDETSQMRNEYGKYDNNPSASSMNADNILKEMPLNITNTTTEKIDEDYVDDSIKVPLNISSQGNDSVKISHSEDINDAHEENDDEGEYVEYYDDLESTEHPHTTPRVQNTESSGDIYDEYDNSEQLEQTHEDAQQNNSATFDVVTMKQNSTTVKDDNFQHFVDTTKIDQLDETYNDTTETNTKVNYVKDNSEELDSVETPSILGQEVVSVVTTKSVVNGTISVPDVTHAPSTTSVTTSSPVDKQNEKSTPLPNTTENWVVVASVQTSRSVSGARFLPFPTVEQDEKKQLLSENEEDDESVTKVPQSSADEELSHHTSSSSTENINDKLDSIQSELSSGVFSGKADKNIEHITETTTEGTTTTTTALNIFTLKSTQAPTVTEKSSPNPLPVLIKKFTHRVATTSTTSAPRKKPSLVTIMDDLSGFLPPGYKFRPSFKDKRTSTTTTTTTTSTTTTTTKSPELTPEEDDIGNGTQGRSSGITSKNKVVILNDKSSLVPKDYKPTPKPNDKENIFKNVKQDDLAKLLPPGYKQPSNSETIKEIKAADIINKVKTVDISQFLPKDYKTTTMRPKIDNNVIINAAPVNITALLPPGFKLNETEGKLDVIPEIKIADIASLLPPDFKVNATEENEPSPSSTKAPTNGFKVVFPSRPGAKPVRKATTPKSSTGNGPDPVTPKIQKGWPTRASTEFTGWPSPSTTPFSIEKLLEAQRNATATSPLSEFSTEAVTRRSTTTTTTTTIPPPSTTPGVCQKECDIAATIKIVAGVKWVPELLDYHTDEWQNLARDVKQELNSIYSKADLLKKWYKGIRIDAFSQGSVLVDYFVELNDVEERIDTLELKKLFHRSLTQAKPGAVVETIIDESKRKFDPDVMLGDEPDEERLSKSDEHMTKTIDKSAGKLEIGKFVMDPAYTEFIVLPKREQPTLTESEEESFLPQWGIAVIVIALASLLFVIIFGVTVLVNRQKSAKAKQPIPLSEDMLRELDKSHMGGFDDVHQMKERDLPYLPSGKRMSTAFIEQLAYPNPGDSWRSEWTPQMQKYMQHYTPDSGRGSQIYGAGGGNPYGYGGSQTYGQTGGGGSQIYGYTGEYPRSHFSRRRSEYDSNF